MQAILFYDHLLTFGQEISRIWEVPGSSASIQFLLTRYFAFFSVRIPQICHYAYDQPLIIDDSADDNYHLWQLLWIVYDD